MVALLSRKKKRKKEENTTLRVEGVKGVEGFREKLSLRDTQTILDNISKWFDIYLIIF
jgi:hypothetical protein